MIKIIEYHKNGKKYNPKNLFMKFKELKSFEGEGIENLKYASLFTHSGYYKDSNHFYFSCTKKIREKFGNDFASSDLLKDFLYTVYDIGTREKKEFESQTLSNPIDYFTFQLNQISEPKKLKELIKEIKKSIYTYLGKEDFGYSVLRNDICTLVGNLDEHIKNKFEDDVLAVSWWSGLNISEEKIEEIKNKKGLYKLFDENKELIYIGKSTVLHQRLPTSIRDKRASYFSYIIFDNEADISILELYLISTLKPKFNSDFKTEDLPSFKLETPKESKLIKIDNKDDD